MMSAKSASFRGWLSIGKRIIYTIIVAQQIERFLSLSGDSRRDDLSGKKRVVLYRVCPVLTDFCAKEEIG